MTNQEALDIFVSCATLDCEHCNMSFRGCEDKPRFNEMRDMVISALEKQIPKKPKVMKTTLVGEKFWWYCGHCGASRHTGSKANYCGYCGGKVDWRNEDE